MRILVITFILACSCAYGSDDEKTGSDTSAELVECNDPCQTEPEPDQEPGEGEGEGETSPESPSLELTVLEDSTCGAKAYSFGPWEDDSTGVEISFPDAEWATYDQRSISCYAYVNLGIPYGYRLKQKKFLVRGETKFLPELKKDEARSRFNVFFKESRVEASGRATSSFSEPQEVALDQVKVDLSACELPEEVEGETPSHQYFPISS